MATLQVRIFSESKIKDLEQKVNDFLKEKKRDIEVKEIKLTSCVVGGVTAYDTVMVVYEE